MQQPMDRPDSPIRGVDFGACSRRQGGLGALLGSAIFWKPIPVFVRDGLLLFGRPHFELTFAIVGARWNA